MAFKHIISFNLENKTVGGVENYPHFRIKETEMEKNLKKLSLSTWNYLKQGKPNVFQEIIKGKTNL